MSLESITDSPVPDRTGTAPVLPLLEAAAALAEDRVVFPVRLRDKHPCVKWGHLEPGAGLVAQVSKDWKYFWRRGGVGIGMRTGAGLVVVDLDPRNSGADDPEAWLRNTVAGLPETLAARTPSGGQHLYFTTSAQLRSRPLAGVSGVDIKARGGFVMVPPSAGYEWISDVAVAPLPAWLERAADRVAEGGSGGAGGGRPFEIRDEISAGGRNDYLVRLGGYLLSQDVSADDLEGWLQDFNDAACKPPLESDEVAAIAASVARYDR